MNQPLFSAAARGVTGPRRLAVSAWRVVGPIAVVLLIAPMFAVAAPRNLFSELLGKSDAEIAAKVQAGYQQLFHGRDDDQRIYYPVGIDEAYIYDINNQDVRSEGMSYGMMIAVQLGHRAEFDRLYRWAKRHMYHEEGPLRGYFAWQCRKDGKMIDPGAASDGEEWIATALLLAADRWGGTAESDSFDYGAEAQSLLGVMLHKPPQGRIRSIFDLREKQVVFAPTAEGALFTDPSYHLPAFYELWTRVAESAEDRAIWADVLRASRAFFHRAAHPQTGLMPEYAHFDGRPFLGDGADKGDFRYDAWRIMANVAIDYANYAADPWQREQSNRILRFLASHGSQIPVLYSLDGKPLTTDSNATGLLAMAAVAGLAADPDVARPFVERLWKVPIPQGQYRYYDGALYELALLQVSGNFRVSTKAVEK